MKTWHGIKAVPKKLQPYREIDTSKKKKKCKSIKGQKHHSPCQTKDTCIRSWEQIIRGLFNDNFEMIWSRLWRENVVLDNQQRFMCETSQQGWAIPWMHWSKGIFGGTAHLLFGHKVCDNPHARCYTTCCTNFYGSIITQVHPFFYRIFSPVLSMSQEIWWCQMHYLPVFQSNI